jgi:predicted GIY-YIG superfamily endonuclease
MSKTNIYVLQLKDGKYYIGKSDNVMKRYEEHLYGDGSAWTKIYKPVSVIKVIENTSPFEEDKITKEYMSIYGISNVRGGSYVSVKLDDIQLEALKRELWSAKDCCTGCGKSGHFIKDCFSTSITFKKEEYEYIWYCEYCDREFKSESVCSLHEKLCKSKMKQNSHKHTKISNKYLECFKCGRIGHYASDCYARTHIKGFYLDSSSDSDSDCSYDSY